MRSVRVLSFVLALAAILSGCASHKTTTPAAPTQAMLEHPALAGGWQLDCLQGSYEQARNASWGQTCEARASHSAGPKEEMWIAVNPTDPKNVIVGTKDLNPESSAPDDTGHCVWNGVFVTHDGGESWKDVTIGGVYSERGPTSPFYGYACNTDPDFKFTKDGAVHYGVEMYGLCTPTPATTAACAANAGSPVTVGWKIVLATSHDGGDTWPDVITYKADTAFTTDYSRMTINPTTQAVVESIGSGDCMVMVSEDGGKTALFYQAITPMGIPCSSNNGAVAGSPKGTLIIVGNGIAARSTDDGKTWTDANQVFTFKDIQQFKESKYRNGSNLELAYDLTDGSRKGTLYAAYGAADKDEADVFVRSSPDDGKTWSDAVLVSSDGSGTHQWMPNIAVAGDGSLHVAYMDKHYDEAHGHKFIDITHAVSVDGGKTWTRERVSTLSFDGDLGVHQDGFPFIGDYLGIDCAGVDCWMGFPDASDGVTTVAAAAHAHLPG
jgi:hypothetical protein